MYLEMLRFRMFCTMLLVWFPVPLIADSKQDQEQMKTRAEQHPWLLSRNTFEPYHSVVACREYCRELIESQDSNDD